MRQSALVYIFADKNFLTFISQAEAAEQAGTPMAVKGKEGSLLREGCERPFLFLSKSIPGSARGWPLASVVFSRSENAKLDHAKGFSG